MACVEQDTQFFRYPPIGEEDWRYGYATAYVRSLETNMLTKNVLVDMVNAPSFEAALDSLSGTEYAVSGESKELGAIEQRLLEKRGELRDMFVDLIDNDALVALLRSREDFANMRLAVRRVVTEKAIGEDYIARGSVPAEEFQEIFQNESYYNFPEYLQEAVEEAILGYYENKDVRQIDFAIDRVQARYRLRTARELGSEFLCSLFRLKIDLNNIATMMRQKISDEQIKDAFIEGGYLSVDKLLSGLDTPLENIGSLFFSTPYYEIIENGANYLRTENSFIGLEKESEDFVLGFLRSTDSITAGSQPVIAYLRLKENEIRMVRLVLTAKKNGLAGKIIQDRLIEL